MTLYADLIPQVRAQIDVDDNLARAWLIDRSRVLNAETGWNWREVTVPGTDQRTYAMPSDAVWVEAVLVGQVPYQRSTLKAMDSRWSGQNYNTVGIYADSVGPNGEPQIQIHPIANANSLLIRYVADVADDATSSPFPSDFDSALVDGAIGVGLARMDERFDSAGYFDARFVEAVGRLKRRRHGQIGSGAVPIRVAF